MDIRRRFLSKKSSGGSSGGDSSGTYTVNLNSQWEKTTAVTNPDSSLYDGVYRSFSNYNVNSGVATMYITLTGCSTFKLYIRSYAESSYDYVMVSQLDKTITGSSSYSDTTLVKAHTRGNQQSGTALSNYTLVEYTGISSGSHTITIVYRKDGSVNSGDDRGYVLIPKSQGSGGDSGGGDVDIDLTHVVEYTSTDGKIVSPYVSQPFNVNITSNTYNTYVSGGLFVCSGPVTSINEDAFKNRSTLKTFTFPSSVHSIGKNAFRNCYNLTGLTIPSHITSIGQYAFEMCGGEVLIQCSIPSSNSSSAALFYNAYFTKVTIDNNITSVGDYAFYECRKLTSLTLGNKITSIGNSAFGWCDKLVNVVIPASVTKIGNSAFNSCDALASVTISDGVTSIGTGAFSGSEALTSITIPDSVTSIGYGAFTTCTSMSAFFGKYASSDNRCLIIDNKLLAFAPLNLTSYTIPESIKIIGRNAFAKCTQLTEIVIPDGTTSIMENAFSGCTGLNIVYCKPTTPPSLGSNTFYNNPSTHIIYVPTASVDAYKSAAYWSTYADYIVGYDFENAGGE